MKEINWYKFKEKGLERVDEDRIKVTTKDGEFVMRDIPYDKIARARELNKKRPEIGVIAAMIESSDGKPFPEETLKGFRTSSFTKLAYAMNLIIDEGGLLSDDQLF